MKPKPSEAVRAKFNDEALPELINVEGILNLEDPVRRATYNIIKEATRNEIIAYLEELEKEEFMTQNGLGDTDMINDNKPPQEI